MLPDAEQLVTTFLRTDPDVVAVFGDNVFTEIPPNHNAWPACRVTRVGGNTDAQLAFDLPLMQIDVWGGPKILAQQGAQKIREAMALRLPKEFPAIGLLALGPGQPFGSLRDLPDTTYEPARPRYLFDVALLTRSPSA